MTQAKKIAIYGAGNFAREVAWLISAQEGDGNYELLGHIEDGASGDKAVNELPIVSLDHMRSEHPDALLSIAVGDPVGRRQMAERASAAGFEFETLVHHAVDISRFNTIGIGSIICCGSILTVNIDIAEHVHVNLDCTIGHDVRIGAYTTISPGVHISGNVHIGENVQIGTGASIIDGDTDDPLVIADGCVIAAGACVTSSTEKDALYAGVPAKLKKRYAE